MTNYRGFHTKCVHAGQAPDKASGALVAPINMSTTFVVGSQSEYTYSRDGNPARKATEDALSALEKVKHTLTLSSGTAAALLIIHLLKPGDHLIASKDIYCGLIKSFMNMHWLENEVSYVDFSNEVEFLSSFKPNTKVIGFPVLIFFRCSGLNPQQIRS